jgi:uncharacterized membrane protein
VYYGSYWKFNSINIFLIMKFLRYICHGQRNRCPIIFQKRFFLCYRCCGFYFFLVSIILILIVIKPSFLNDKNYILPSIIFLSIPCYLDWLSHKFKLRKTNNIIRFIVGAFLGIGCSFALYYILFI